MLIIKEKVIVSINILLTLKKVSICVKQNMLVMTKSTKTVSIN